jgi:hypothetical protein
VVCSWWSCPRSRTRRTTKRCVARWSSCGGNPSSIRKRSEALGERLKRLELQNAPGRRPTGAAWRDSANRRGAGGAGHRPRRRRLCRRRHAGRAQALGGPPTGSPSALDLLSPRQPFALYQQRGAGQLLFDASASPAVVGNLTQRNVQKAQDGTFSGRENRFFPREVELSLFGQIDPYARADVRIEAGEEAPGQDTGVNLAEATITLLALPWGTQAKLGQMRNRYGWSNVVHEHDLPWVDRPDVYRIFFGEEGWSRKGARPPGCRISCRSISRCSAACSTATTRLRSATAASPRRWSPAASGRSSS